MAVNNAISQAKYNNDYVTDIQLYSWISSLLSSECLKQNSGISFKLLQIRWFDLTEKRLLYQLCKLDFVPLVPKAA